jgi:hypothetical protein
MTLWVRIELKCIRIQITINPDPRSIRPFKATILNFDITKKLKMHTGIFYIDEWKTFVQCFGSGSAI